MDMLRGLVFFDASQDPVIRRRMWSVVRAMRDERTIVLSTHIMEEVRVLLFYVTDDERAQGLRAPCWTQVRSIWIQAEALCSRIGIMVRGSLACIGSPEHLQQVYGSGYFLDVNCVNDDNACPHRARVLAAVTQLCPAATVTGSSRHLRPHSLPPFPLDMHSSFLLAAVT